MARMARNQVLKVKSKMPRSLKEKVSRNYRNKVNKYLDKFGYNIPNNSRELLLLDKKNVNTLWADAISEEVKLLEKLGVLQFYPPKTKFENKYGWQIYANACYL